MLSLVDWNCLAVRMDSSCGFLLTELARGAGGLSTGYGLSGYVDTRWAIEMAQGAASTYQ
jgi:hypothetical protein